MTEYDATELAFRNGYDFRDHEIIRCKECDNRNCKEDRKEDRKDSIYCERHQINRDPDAFCSDGRRKS